MDEDAIKSQLEILEDAIGIQLTSRQIKKFTNLAIELLNEDAISIEEIVEEFSAISPDDDDDWEEFVDQFSNYIFEMIKDDVYE